MQVDPAEVQALRQELDQARKALEDRVSRSELTDLVQEAVAEARQVITRLEAENAELVRIKGELHGQVQTVLRTQQTLVERLENNTIEHRRLNDEEQRRMRDEHQAELERLHNMHKGEM